MSAQGPLVFDLGFWGFGAKGLGPGLDNSISGSTCMTACPYFFPDSLGKDILYFLLSSSRQTECLFICIFSVIIKKGCLFKSVF